MEVKDGRFSQKDQFLNRSRIELIKIDSIKKSDQKNRSFKIDVKMS